MYDLDDEKEEEAIDITPDFMKHEDAEPDLEAGSVEAGVEPGSVDTPRDDGNEGDEGEGRKG
jgi:hypothetical protein